MAIKFNKDSAYNKTGFTSWYTSTMIWPKINNDPSDKIVILSKEYEKRPDKLAYDLYGTANLFWVFSIRNSFIVDPIEDFIAGIEIIIPSKATLEKALGI